MMTFVNLAFLFDVNKENSMKNYLLSLSLGSIILFSGCHSTISYQKLPLSSCAYNQDKEENVSTQKNRLIIDEIKNSSHYDLLSLLKTELINTLIEAKVVDILDRKTGIKTNEELKLHDNGAVLQGADYLINAEIINASFVHDFTPSKELKGVPLSPSITRYHAKVTLALTLFDVKQQKITKIFSSIGEESSTELGQSASSIRRYDSELMTLALKKGIASLRIDLYEALAQTGYVIEKRHNEKDDYVLISLGTNDGLQEGQTVDFFTKETMTLGTNNLFSGEKLTHEGISVEVLNNQAWIKLSSPSPDICKNSRVKIRYKKQLTDYMNPVKTVF